MKKINILLISLMVGMGFYSCQKDEMVTINPAAEKGDLTFVLNKTQYDNFTFMLDEGNDGFDMDALTTQQPDYGFTAAVTYYIQASFNQNMKDSVELTSSVKGEKVAINVKDMNKAMLQLYKGNMPKPTVARDVYVRLRAVVSDATPTPLTPVKTVKSLYSNAIKLSIKPYFMQDLVAYYQAKKIMPYYIVGYNGWDNSVGGLGSNLIPLSVVEGNKYDPDGKGTYVYTGYFEASKEFKLIRDIGKSEEQWGNKGAAGINAPINKSIAGEEPKNFQVPTDGYYTITLNSITNVLTIEPNTTNPKIYTSMGIIGEFNSWGGDDALTPYQATKNHVWYKEKTFTGQGNYLFRAEGNWDLKFGAPTDIKGDPIYQKAGLAKVGKGSDILETAGTYILIINDVDGCYYAIKK